MSHATMVRSSIIAAALIWILPTSNSYASAGTPDGAFGINGLATFGRGTALHATDDDHGRLLISGVRAHSTIVVARTTASGTLDGTFGELGFYNREDQLLFGVDYLEAKPLADGKLMVFNAGRPFCNSPSPGANSICNLNAGLLQVTRLLGAGTSDPTWMPAVHNAVRLDSPSAHRISSGTFLISGTDGFPQRRAVIHALSDQGSYANALPGLSRQALNCPGTQGLTATSLKSLTQPDGKTIVAQTLEPFQATAFSYRVCLSRMNSDGTVDPTFANSGHNTLLENEFTAYSSRIVALLVRPGGGFQLILQHQLPLGDALRPHFTISRYNSNGSLASRADGGITGFTALHVARVDVVALQPDGKLLIAGLPWIRTTQTDLDHQRPVIGRLDANGSNDLSFGTNGTGSTALISNGRRLMPKSIHLAHDGSIFVAGALDGAPTVDAEIMDPQMAVIKLQADPPPAPPPPAQSSGSGGGCGTLNGKGPVDPTLSLLAMLALLALLSRHRLANIRTQTRAFISHPRSS